MNVADFDKHLLEGFHPNLTEAELKHLLRNRLLSVFDDFSHQGMTREEIAATVTELVSQRVPEGGPVAGPPPKKEIARNVKAWRKNRNRPYI